MASEIDDFVRSDDDDCVTDDDRRPLAKVRCIREAPGGREFPVVVTSRPPRGETCNLALFVGIAVLAWSVRGRALAQATQAHRCAEAHSQAAASHWLEYRLVQILWLNEPVLARYNIVPREVPRRDFFFSKLKPQTTKMYSLHSTLYRHITYIFVCLHCDLI